MCVCVKKVGSGKARENQARQPATRESSNLKPDEPPQRIRVFGCKIGVMPGAKKNGGIGNTRGAQDEQEVEIVRGREEETKN